MTHRTALSARFTRSLSPLALLAAGTALWACDGKFRRSCPEGTTQTAGGGDIDVACTSNDALAGMGGSAGAGAGGS
ncbi:MAG TPA: hypothetical protein VFS00_31960, partial [Polyangiaceae bacterium]|nr:hypothetical protein [Polyangiaceae bacterium]